MRLARFDLKTSYGEKFKVYPIGDLHIDRVEFDEERFNQYIEVIANDPLAIWVLVGDIHDGRVPGDAKFEPQSVRHKYLLDLDDYVPHTLQEATRLLSPLKASRGVILEGNHDRYIRWSGFAHSIANALEVPFLGGEGLLGVRVVETNGEVRGRSRYYRIYVCHGTGNGWTAGGKINRNSELIRTAEAEIYISGHVHDGNTRVISTPTLPVNGGLQWRDRAYVIAPGFMRPRVEGVVGYQGRGSRPMTDQGLVYLVVDPRTDRIYREECMF